MAATRRVFRVLYEARPRAGTSPPNEQRLALVSVAVTALDATAARELARRLLIPYGWEPVGGPLRISDLTGLMASAADTEDASGFADHAARWLKEIHDEALREGSSVQMLSGDYDFLHQSQPLPRLGHHRSSHRRVR